MSPPRIECPRCFRYLPAAARFCTRCGRASPAVGDVPLQLAAGGHTWRILDRIAIGSISTLHRCHVPAAPREPDAVFKIARDPRTNDLIHNEQAVLRQLHDVDRAARFAPFLPKVEATLAIDGRAGSVLKLDPEIRSTDELYTLDDLAACFPDGLDPRHVAWIWRRLLSVLGFIHAHQVVHAAVLPEHILIEPREHKLLLVDWCCAALDWQNNRRPVPLFGGRRNWYRAALGGLRMSPTPALDIATGARCMLDLLGPQTAAPPAAPPAITRHFQRCTSARAPAWRLLDDFDRLIETLWGQDDSWNSSCRRSGGH